MTRDELFSILGLAGHLPVLPAPSTYTGSREDLFQVIRKTRLELAPTEFVLPGVYTPLLRQPNSTDLLGIKDYAAPLRNTSRPSPEQASWFFADARNEHLVGAGILAGKWTVPIFMEARFNLADQGARQQIISHGDTQPVGLAVEATGQLAILYRDASDQQATAVTTATLPFGTWINLRVELNAGTSEITVEDLDSAIATETIDVSPGGISANPTVAEPFTLGIQNIYINPILNGRISRVAFRDNVGQLIAEYVAPNLGNQVTV